MKTAVLIQDHIETMDIPILSAYKEAERERLLARKNGKSFRDEIAEMINIKLIHDGDNKEWAFFLGKITGKLEWYIYRITHEWRFCEDIAANSIADLFASRKVFETTDHMIGHLFQFARIESFRWMKQGPGKFVLDDDILLKIDWYLHNTSVPIDALDVQERIAMDEWRDKMLILLKEEAARLPPAWRDFVHVHFTYRTRSEFFRYCMEMGYQRSLQESALNRLKLLVHDRLNGVNRVDQIEDLRYALRYLPDTHKRAIRATIGSKNNMEACAKMGVTYATYKAYMEKAMKTIRKVYNDPITGNFSTAVNRLTFFNGITDERFKQVLKEEVLDAKDVGRVARFVKLVSKEKVREIVLLRNQHRLPWEQIAVRVGIDYKKVRKIYDEEVPKEERALLDLKLPIRPLGKLNMEKAMEIRRLYRSGDYTQAQLASMYGVVRTAIQSIIENRNWKYVEGGKITP